MRLTRWSYRCGRCLHYYELPGIDLSFFYGSFLGVSVNLEAAVFETVSYVGFDEIATIVDSLGHDVSHAEGEGWWTQRVLTEVSDPDPSGARYIFTGTPGCPACGSMQLSTYSETERPWPRSAGIATHDLWDRMDYPSKVARIRAALRQDHGRHDW